MGLKLTKKLTELEALLSIIRIRSDEFYSDISQNMTHDEICDIRESAKNMKDVANKISDQIFLLIDKVANVFSGFKQEIIRLRSENLLKNNKKREAAESA